MTHLTRRSALFGAGAAALTAAACTNPVGSRDAQVIDARADAALNFLEGNFAGTRDLRERSSGLLVMPVVTEAGFGFGGSYGEGALRVDGVTVDYYSAADVSFGF